jgi:hypothetical protein
MATARNVQAHIQPGTGFMYCTDTGNLEKFFRESLLGRPYQVINDSLRGATLGYKLPKSQVEAVS